MKNLIILSFLIFLVSGCSKAEIITCTLENTEAKITIKKDIVVDITAQAEFNSEELTKNMCPIIKSTVKNMEDVSCEEQKIIISNYQNSIEIANLQKKTVIDYFESQSYICK